MYDIAGAQVVEKLNELGRVKIIAYIWTLERNLKPL
jgi:hypothetical protein